MFCNGARSLRDSAAIKVLHLLAYNGPAWMRRQTAADVARISRAHAYGLVGGTIRGLDAAIELTWIRFARDGEIPQIRDGSPKPDLRAIASAAEGP